MASYYTDIDRYIETLEQCKLITITEVKDLCSMAKRILSEESNVLELQSPLTICGNLEGNFPALQEIFKLVGRIPDTNFLFLGDLVDRGYYSIETILLLFAYKVRYPIRLNLIRGKHESRAITQVYGFYDECLNKYRSTDVWRYCTDVFDYFPLSATINNQTFCVHGGLSRLIYTLDQLRLIIRDVEVPCEGAMCDLIWSDPQELDGWGISPRGAGCLYGGNIVKNFNHINGLDMICRSNQLELQGYRWYFKGKLLSIWSTPNHCYRMGNPAAILSLDTDMTYSIAEFYEPKEGWKV
ncbi:Protein phsophatase-2a [Oopsacas minuta]|uniref:protein-serine/threonine phosphatase n=1 Tax=Oopsacas minuta TaxID=111878 RepID=A0AAV7JX56_9METZ|nr:Protein phsophatase-2a [Oopsacas minuta]